MERLRARIGLRGEKGQAVIFVAAALPVLLVAAALVIDGSNLFVHKRDLQNAVDAAALAAAQDLSPTGCAAACAAAAGEYAGQNHSNPASPPTSRNPLPLCASPLPSGPKNCYRNPYNGDATKVEVWLTRSVPTLFGNIFGFSHDVTARAVSTIGPGEPPPLSFAALQNDEANCEHHTLVVRTSGHLTVGNTIYTASCNGFKDGNPHSPKDDAFDIFGVGGLIEAPRIYVHGGWETHDHSTVRVDGTNCPLEDSSTEFMPSSDVNPPTLGCPEVGQPLIPDPFEGKIRQPALGAPAWGGLGAPVTVTRMKRFSNVATFTTATPHGLLAGDKVTVIGVDPTLDNTYTVATAPTTTTFTVSNTGSNFPLVTKKQLTSGVATLTASPNTALSAGQNVTVSGIDTVFDGTFPVSAVGPGGATFSYLRPRGPISRSVSRKGLTGGVVTLQTSANHTLVIGDIFNVAGVDPLLNGGPFTVTGIPSNNTLTYAAPTATMNVPVTRKALANSTTLTLTTSAAHGLPDFGFASVNIGDLRFDGSYTTGNNGATTIVVTVPPVVATVTNKAVSANVATLTTNAATPPFETGDTITVNTGDPRFDGTSNVVVTAVNAAAQTFSYVPATFQNTIWTWNAASRTVTMNLASDYGLQTGNVLRTSGWGGAQTCFNVAGANFTITRLSATSFSYTIPAAITCTPGASGNQHHPFSIQTVASAPSGGDATLVTMPSITCNPAPCGTVTVPAWILANTNVNPAGTITTTGDIALTDIASPPAAFSPAESLAPAGAFAAKNNPGAPGVPAQRLVPAGTPGTVNLPAGTYYGGICIGNPVGVNCDWNHCGPTYASSAYSPVQTLVGAIDEFAETIRSSGTAIQNGQFIMIDGEQMLVLSGGGTTILQVRRAQRDTISDAHGSGRAITRGVVASPTGTVNVTLDPDGTYIMAGGGFWVCGNATVSAPNVFFFNTNDVLGGTEYEPLGPFVLNTSGAGHAGRAFGRVLQGPHVLPEPRPGG